MTALTVYYAAGGSHTTFHRSEIAAAFQARYAYLTRPEPISGWKIEPGRQCVACIGNDSYLDPPCPICGGSGIDKRPEVRHV